MRHQLTQTGCSQSANCPDTVCKDKSCPLPDNACINFCTTGTTQGLIWVDYPSSERYGPIGNGVKVL